jgi:hypothetical protein
LLQNYSPPTFDSHLVRTRTNVIYHYTNQSGFLGIVENKELWATKIHFMNDSSEFRIAFDMIEERLTRSEIGDHNVLGPMEGERWSSLTPRQRRAHIFWRGMERIINVNVCVVCFCTSGDLLSQWRGYSGGSGLSIGFSVQGLQAVGDERGFLLAPCIYDKSEQSKIIQELCDHYLEDPSIKDYDTGYGFFHTATRCAAFFKDASFYEEDEWRLVSPPIEAREFEFRSGRSTLIPYYKVKLPLASDSSPIEHVIVGPCPHMDSAVSAVETMLIREKIGKQHVGPPGIVPQVSPSAIPYRNW